MTSGFFPLLPVRLTLIRTGRHQRHQPRPSVSATRESQGRGAECCQGPTQELETRGFGERWHALTTLRLLEPIGIVRSFSSPGAWARTVSSVTERKVKGAEASFMDTGQEQQHAARALGRSYVRVPLRSSLLLQPIRFLAACMPYTASLLPGYRHRKSSSRPLRTQAAQAEMVVTDH